MVNKLKKAALVLAGLAMLGTPVWAETDYSGMTTEELSQIRGTLHDVSQEERDAFRAEWQKRIQELTQEERQNYVGRPANAPAAGSGLQQGRGQGSGKGRGRGFNR